MKFAADSMLGRLARWLRVLGYDTLYRSFYKNLDEAAEGRCLLTRNGRIIERFEGALLVRGDRVGDQILEVRKRLGLNPDRSSWFSRCILCNVPLQEVSPDRALENIPEFVFYQNVSEIRSCPSCGRYYWRGSHRERMLRQLREWGFDGS